MSSQKVSFVGCGRVGRTLARALKDAGYEVGMIMTRHDKSTHEAIGFVGAGIHATDAVSAALSGNIHFIATNDDAIEEVVASLDEQIHASLKDHYYFHFSGSITSEALEPLKKKGAAIGSIHPLQVFADPQKALETLPGVYYAIEGEDKAMELAVQMVDRLQGKLLLIPTGRKVLYHAAGVFAANYLTVLMNVALGIMEEIGESPEDAYQAFLPLMVGALQNIEEFGVPGALTGPAVRGDARTIHRHLEALEQLKPEWVTVYKVLGQEAVEIAARHGSISPDVAKRLFALLALNEEDK
jgi:predicted short-subunit dehydrogenase-like oxidoreductase (DUF2520 family)